MIEPHYALRQALPLPILKATVLYWALLKAASLFVGFPDADEAYYWLWGQHLALSYLDHAPLHAWLQGLVSMGFGWNLLALRLLTIVTAVSVLWILFDWAKRIEPDNWRPRFWLSAALFYSSPIMMIYTTVAIHDRLLVALLVASLHFFGLFFVAWARGEARYRTLYLAAVILGLAVLTKYSGALLGPGVALTVLLRPELRSLLRSPHLYLAAFIGGAIQFPALYWNVVHAGASAELHLAGLSFRGVAASTANLQRLLLESVLLLSPFVVLPMVRFLVQPSATTFPGMLHSAARWTFVASTAVVIVAAFYREVLFYWNIVAYAAFFAAGVWAFRTRLGQALQIGWGAIVSTGLFLHVAVVPFLPTPEAGKFYGWDQVAAQVVAARSEYAVDFLAASNWRDASQLAFAIRDPDVMSLAQGRDAFDFWFDAEAHAGKDAIVMTEAGGAAASHIRLSFARFEKLGTVEIDYFGTTESRFELYLGRGFIP